MVKQGFQAVQGRELAVRFVVVPQGHFKAGVHGQLGSHVI